MPDIPADLQWHLTPGRAGTGVRTARDADGRVYIRAHSGGDASPTLIYTADEWRRFTTAWLANPLGTDDMTCIPIGNGGGWSWRHNGAYLRFTDEEIQRWGDELRWNLANPTPPCRAERPGHRRGDRIIRCLLVDGHNGDHEETDTGIRWPEPPGPPEPPIRVGIITWDHAEQPDPDRLAVILSELSGGLLHVRRPDTGSDQYALMVATRPLDQQQTDTVFDQWWRDEQAADVIDLEPTGATT